jgi:hypothetical protein
MLIPSRHLLWAQLQGLLPKGDYSMNISGKPCEGAAGMTVVLL